MIELPDFSKAFEYEKDFYLSCNNTRLGYIIIHYELFKMINDLPGAIIECGIFKGNSFIRFATFRNILGNSFSHELIGFDTFGKFPKTKFEDDIKYRERFVEAAGEDSISKEQLLKVLEHKGINNNVELINGDITETVVKYVEDNPHLKVSLLNLDTDIYEPATTILQYLYPKIVKGGILILDNYGIFPGETKAVDDYFSDKDVIIKQFPFAMTPCYIIKN